MLSSQNQIFTPAKPSSHQSSDPNRLSINYLKNSKLIHHFLFKYLWLSIALISLIVMATLVTQGSLFQPENAIADSSKSGCDHPNGCFVPPDNY